MDAPERTAYRTCPLCEATCGLELAVNGDAVTRVRGDRDDVFSHGYLCPKGSALGKLHHDPDRLRRPLVRRNGELTEVSWDEAFAEVARLWMGVVERHGRDATAVYVGNPSVHSLDNLVFNKVVLRAAATPHLFSSATVDQRPREIASGMVYGSPGTLPVPDLERTDFLLLLGANPVASNGSLATAPDWPGRLEAIRARGGTIVVVDPRRTETVRKVAHRHLPIRPGTDALALAAMVTTLAEEGLVDLGGAADYVTGAEAAVAACAPFTPEAVAGATGVAAEDVRALARDLAASPSAAIHGRMGTSTQAFGTTTSWLIDVLTALTGNLDRPGGILFARPAAGGVRGQPRYGRGLTVSSRRSRVSGLPAWLGEQPVATLAEEIETPGASQIRALLTIAGNPVVSTPNGGGRLDQALQRLDCLVSVDIYLNETSRHAHVVLPPPSPLERPHYDLTFLLFSVRNVANYSPAVFPPPPGQPAEWEILAKLGLLFEGRGPDAAPAEVDERMITKMIETSVDDPGSPAHGRDPAELLAALEPRRGPDRILDLMLRTGPYGEGFGNPVHPAALSLDRLLAAPHGVDLGPLEPRLPEVLRTPSGMVELAPPLLVEDLRRLATALHRPGDGMVLIGRRQLRSNNSWLHNIEVLVKGKDRCTLQVHPDDAERLGLADGKPATVRSRTGEIVAPVEVTDDVRPGVVSIPHGWGHDTDGARLGVASTHPGVNVNLLADEGLVDPVSGASVLNGIPVEVSA